MLNLLTFVLKVMLHEFTQWHCIRVLKIHSREEDSLSISFVYYCSISDEDRAAFLFLLVCDILTFP